MAKEEIADFLNNPFSIGLMRDFGEATRGFHKLKGFRWNENNYHLLNKRQQFQSDVFKIQTQLSNTTEQIRMIRIFLNRLPFKDYYLKNGISQPDYIQYHTEVLSHKVHTVLEIMKLMINRVYELNIPEKDCSWLELCKKVSKKDLSMQYTDQYFKTFKNLIDARHLNSHRGIYNDSEKEKIDKDHMYSMYKLEAVHGYTVSEDLKKAFPKVYIEFEIKAYKKSRVKFVDDVLKYNALILKDFLGSLSKPYLQRLSEY